MEHPLFVRKVSLASMRRNRADHNIGTGISSNGFAPSVPIPQFV